MRLKGERLEYFSTNGGRWRILVQNTTFGYKTPIVRCTSN